MENTNCQLPKAEIYFYLTSWTLSVFYALYHVYLVGNKYLHLLEKDLSNGWNFINRRQDNMDYEWMLWKNFMLKTISLWIIMHFVVAYALRYVHEKMLPLWYTVVTSSFLMLHFGFNTFLMLILQPIIFSLMLYFRSRIMIWIIPCILSYTFTHQEIVPLYSSTYGNLKIVIPALMWVYLRCISFGAFTLNNKMNLHHFYQFFGYVFYLPSFFLGPILLYDDFSRKNLLKMNEKKSFCRKIYEKSNSNVFEVLQRLCIQNIRYLFWMFFTDFALHFIYVTCLQQYVDMLMYIKYDNVWIMYGIGFSMGQLFFLKYTVVYGLASAWTNAEGYDTPQPPRCIARIHLYSDMWRYFDQGLYRFIKKYIYEPCTGSSSFTSNWKRIYVSFLCFTFVYVWHGLDYSVFMWSLLNFVGIVIETLGKQTSKTYYYRKFKLLIGIQNERRLLAFICSPLTIVSAITNFYFLGGALVAETYFSYIFKHGTVSNIICLWFFMYTMCQGSMELKMNQKSNQNCNINNYVL